MRHIFFLASLIGAAGAPLASSQAPAKATTTITVRLSNFQYTPKTIILDQGRNYVLQLQNVAGGGHDFTAAGFFASATVAPESRSWIRKGSVEVPPGGVREIALTAPAAGRYKVRCTHRFHRMLGMSGTIIVR